MRRISKSIVPWLGVLLALTVGMASATPMPNSAVIRARIFNDCPISILTTNNSYPASVSIGDQNQGCVGFANLHNWRFSEDGTNPAVFNNGDCFHFGAILVISGPGEAEAGLQVSPWWSQDVDGRFNVRTTDGEIACFGGRLPFYSFSGAPHNLRYTKGDAIVLKINYNPHGLTQANPATIEYVVVYNNTLYSSGNLAFDMGNPNDPPHGFWGMLDDARVGGHFQYFVGMSAPDRAVTVTWSDIKFQDCPVAVEPAHWGSIKQLFR